MELLPILGSGVVAAGVIAFLGRLYLEPKLEALRSDNNVLNETLKARLQKDVEEEKAEHAKRLQIHAVQFAEQFKIYRTLYRSIVLLQWRLNQIMPVMDIVPEGKTWADIAPERFDRASKTLRSFIRIFEYNEPLVSKEIRPAYDRLIEKTKEIRGLIRIEVHYQKNGRPPYKKGQEDPYIKMERLCKEFEKIRHEVRDMVAKKIRDLYDAEISE